MVCALHPSMQRQANLWSTVPGQPELHRETLCQIIFYHGIWPMVCSIYKLPGSGTLQGWHDKACVWRHTVLDRRADRKCSFKHHFLWPAEKSGWEVDSCRAAQSCCAQTHGCGEKEMAWSVLLLYLSLLRHLNFHKNPPIGQAVPNHEWKEWVYVHCSPFWIIWFSTEHTLPYDNRGKTGIKWWFYVEFLQNFYKELHEMGGLEFFWKKKTGNKALRKFKAF